MRKDPVTINSGYLWFAYLFIVYNLIYKGFKVDYKITSKITEKYQ